jgi:hypothetical protein
VEAQKYSNPTKFCGVIMKGGVTSGVIYPLAACELAQVYQFKEIGGTSARAIAAGAIAAAEYGRKRGGASFAELEKLPAWLAERSKPSGNANLFCLFEPSQATRPLFKMLVTLLGLRGKAGGLRLLLSGLHIFRKRGLEPCQEYFYLARP